MTVVDALVCVEPGKLQLEKRSAPTVAPGDVLVKPRRIGICGTDYHIYEGKHPYLQYPRVMGHELAVEVVQAEAEAGLAPGQICVVNPYVSCGHCVACRAEKPNCCVNISVLGVHRDGGMTGLIAVPARNLILGDGLSVDECAIVEFLAIGAHAVRRGSVTALDRVLIVGAGPIGLGVALFARLAGCDVAVLDRDPERVEAAKAVAGVRAISLPNGASSQAGTVDAAESFDIVFDATGNWQSMEKGFGWVAHGGRYVLVSVVTGTITFSDPDFHRKEMSLLGSRNATSKDFAHVMSAIRSGYIAAEKLITHRTTLADSIEWIPRWSTEKTGLIKAVLEIG